jgi:hypothetical protein
MIDIVIEKIKNITLPIGVMWGLIGANIYIFGSKNAFTIGQKFIIIFNGVATSYLTGMLCEHYHVSTAMTAVVGYASGMFGYSIVVQAIENQASWMHYFTLKAGDLIDAFITRLKKIISK